MKIIIIHTSGEKTGSFFKAGRRGFPIRFLLLVPALLLLFACGGKEEVEKQGESIPPGIYYYFSPGEEQVLGHVRPVPPSYQTTREEMLSHLGEELTKTYFGTVDTHGKTSISFELMGLTVIPCNTRNYHIAVINMEDPESDGLRYFFQGSFGGQVTFAMIAGTFLQPQNDPPLIDGLILTYNRGAFPVLDHIDFQGIITPSNIERAVRKAIASTHAQPSVGAENPPLHQP